jgi:hypothetical protein
MNYNSDIHAKILIRNKVFNFYHEVDTVIDYFCGDCEITKRFWSHISGDVICVDAKKQNSGLPGNVKRIIGDNRKYLGLSKKVNVLDLDSYGLIVKFIEKILEITEVDKLVFFTDGSPTKDMKFNGKSVYKFKKGIDIINPDSCEYAINTAWTAFYGFLYKKL